MRVIPIRLRAKPNTGVHNHLRMQIKLLGWIALAFLGAIMVGVFWYLFAAPKPVPTTGQQQPVTLPSSGTATSTPTPTESGEQTLVVPIQNGMGVVTKDFIHDPSTMPDPSNAGNYYLTGSSTEGYSIGYRTPAQFFTIILQQEPIGATRIAAENFLLAKLGISKSQMCSLNYYLGTDVHTNSLYAGRSLGFSFCPDAVTLPQ